LTVADLSHRYLWGPAVDQILADEQLPAPPSGSLPTANCPPPTVVWPLTDNQGTVRDLAVYNAATGVTSVANHRVYDSFGNLESQTNAAVGCIFGFTGRPLDPAGSGLQNNNARIYDAVLGDWMSKDPTSFTAGDTNTGRYCGNSPTSATDPSGCNADLDARIARIRAALAAGHEAAAAADALAMYQKAATLCTPLTGTLLLNWLAPATGGTVTNPLIINSYVQGILTGSDVYTGIKLALKARLSRLPTLSGCLAVPPLSEWSDDLFWFNVQFNGTYSCPGGAPGKVTLTGSWSISTKYAWKKDGWQMNVDGTPIPDNLALLVQKYYHLGSFQVHGTFYGSITFDYTPPPTGGFSYWWWSLWHGP
jgi:RHS repeat-associated protein